MLLTQKIIVMNMIEHLWFGNLPYISINMAKWWIDSKRNKKYYVLYDEIKEPGIPLDKALELYSESSSDIYQK
jgi:hypothetical protein